MDLSYLIAPFLAWVVAGGIKFLVNSLRARRLAFDLIGYGGLPSNHAAIVSSMACLVGFKEGLAHPAFGVALALAFIVLLDAASLRRHVGRQAKAINSLRGSQAGDEHHLRERIGHSRTELLAGVAVGLVVAYLVHRLFS